MSSISSKGDEGLSRDQKIRHRVDYQRCYRRGRRRYGNVATLHFHPNEQHEARLGITASRKVGKAVVRHRIKRRVREIFRRFDKRRHLPTMDIVVHLKPGSGQTSFADLEREVVGFLDYLIHRSRSNSRSRQ